VVDLTDDGRLHTTDIGDDRTAALERLTGRLGDLRHRGRDEHQLGVRIETGRVDRPEPEATREAAFVAVEARDVPSLLAQGEGDRAADQPDADHRRTTAQFAHGRSVEGVIVGDVTGESRRRPTALPRRRSWWR